MDLTAFMYGVVVGIVLSIFFGWLWNLYRSWVRKRDAVRKPQSVVYTSKQTPQEVFRDSWRARSKIWMFRILFAVMGWMLVEAFLPGLAQEIRQVVGSIWQSLFG